MSETNAEQVKVIEVDTMTGAERYISTIISREQADSTVAWREEHITRRYAYRIVPVEPHMTDNEAAEQRHAERHGSWPMSECGDVDCMEAGSRLLLASFAADDSTGEAQQ